MQQKLEKEKEEEERSPNKTISNWTTKRITQIAYADAQNFLG